MKWGLVMLNKSQKIRRLYQEFRDVVGDEFSAGEIIEIADLLVRADSDRKAERLIYVQDARRTFEELDVYEAMTDGGWRVLGFERTIANSYVDDFSCASDCHKFAQAVQLGCI